MPASVDVGSRLAQMRLYLRKCVKSSSGSGHYIYFLQNDDINGRGREDDRVSTD